MLSLDVPARPLASSLGGLLALLLLLAPSAVQAQGINSDRPGFGDGSATLMQGTLQTELGTAFGNDDYGPSAELGQLLVRYGATDFLEFRAGVGSIALDAPDAEYTGTSLGAKLRLAQTSTTRLSVVSSVGLANGSGFYSSDNVSQSAKLALDGALGSNLTLTLNGGLAWTYSDSNTTTYLFIPTLSIGINENAGAYVGYAGFYTEFRNQNWVEGGFTFTPTPNTQIDINTGLQLDEYGDAVFIGIGLAQRF